MKRSVLTDFAAVAAIIILIALTFFWSEARKEVIYLCGNFYPGVTKVSVVRQLNTANLLRYNDEDIEFGSRITADSLLHFGMFNCEVLFNKAGLVIESNAN